MSTDIKALLVGVGTAVLILGAEKLISKWRYSSVTMKAEDRLYFSLTIGLVMGLMFIIWIPRTVDQAEVMENILAVLALVGSFWLTLCLYHLFVKWWWKKPPRRRART